MGQVALAAGMVAGQGCGGAVVFGHVGQADVGQGAVQQILRGVAGHFAERRVGHGDSAVHVEQRQADVDAVEDGAKARLAFALGALGMTALVHLGLQRQRAFAHPVFDPPQPAAQSQHQRRQHRDADHRRQGQQPDRAEQSGVGASGLRDHQVQPLVAKADPAGLGAVIDGQRAAVAVGWSGQAAQRAGGLPIGQASADELVAFGQRLADQRVEIDQRVGHRRRAGPGGRQGLGQHHAGSALVVQRHNGIDDTLVGGQRLLQRLAQGRHGHRVDATAVGLAECGQRPQALAKGVAQRHRRRLLSGSRAGRVAGGWGRQQLGSGLAQRVLLHPFKPTKADDAGPLLCPGLGQVVEQRRAERAAAGRQGATQRPQCVQRPGHLCLHADLPGGGFALKAHRQPCLVAARHFGESKQHHRRQRHHRRHQHALAVAPGLGRLRQPGQQHWRGDDDAGPIGNQPGRAADQQHRQGLRVTGRQHGGVRHRAQPGGERRHQQQEALQSRPSVQAQQLRVAVVAQQPAGQGRLGAYHRNLDQAMAQGGADEGLGQRHAQQRCRHGPAPARGRRRHRQAQHHRQRAEVVGTDLVARQQRLKDAAEQRHQDQAQGHAPRRGHCLGSSFNRPIGVPRVGGGQGLLRVFGHGSANAVSLSRSAGWVRIRGRRRTSTERYGALAFYNRQCLKVSLLWLGQA